MARETPMANSVPTLNYIPVTLVPTVPSSRLDKSTLSMADRQVSTVAQVQRGLGTRRTPTRYSNKKLVLSWELPVGSLDLAQMQVTPKRRQA